MISKTTHRLLAAFSILVAVWLVAPTLIVIPISFTDKASLVFPVTGWSTRWYENFFTNPTWVGSLVNSFRIAAVVAVVATVIGTAAAVALHRRAGARSNTPLQGLLMAPMIVPGIVLAVGVYAVFLRIGLTGTFLGFVLAHTVMALPFVVVAVGASLASFDNSLLAASASLGANPWTTFLRVTLPSIMPGVISGFLFAFIASFDEVILALFIQSPYLRTLPVKMFTSVTRDTDPTVAAASTLILCITSFMIVVGVLLTNKNRRRHADDQ
ncbi:ABC transporter permease [Aeromicrobium sp. JJY06]|uniref:ABC transporter permease n=1 Tax=Aeromicrobium sp. JJY06 TaxID=3373478 RepID=UPI00376F3E46